MADKSNQSYSEMQSKLETMIEQLQAETLDIDKALILHKEAELLVSKMETYLKQTKNEIKHLKNNV